LLRRVRGTAAQSVLVAVQLLVLNLTLIWSFLEQLERDPGFEKKKQRRANRKTRLSDYKPIVREVSNSPPLAS
jgi:choline-glycine betaine transporter